MVILGGGWGGMTTARHVREQAPDLEVVLIERNPVFWSCPLSNKWLIDVVDTNFLVHSYMAPARRFGYTFVQAEITEVDRAKRRVHTTQGHVDYDWLVISAGIRYGFEAWFGNDRKAIEYTRTNYATAYIPSAEHALVPGDRVLAVLPLYHINAFAVTMLAPLAHGGSLAMPPKFSAARFWASCFCLSALSCFSFSSCALIRSSSAAMLLPF